MSGDTLSNGAIVPKCVTCGEAWKVAWDGMNPVYDLYFDSLVESLESNALRYRWFEHRENGGKCLEARLYFLCAVPEYSPLIRCFADLVPRRKTNRVMFPRICPAYGTVRGVYRRTIRICTARSMSAPTSGQPHIAKTERSYHNVRVRNDGFPAITRKKHQMRLRHCGIMDGFFHEVQMNNAPGLWETQ